MEERPTLVTRRLILRPFTLEDAPDVKQLAGDRDVAVGMGNMPYPYEDGMAEEWILAQQAGFEKGEQVNFAITRRDQGFLIGSIGLFMERQHQRANLGYWVGKPYWNQGFGTEAARAVLQYGFETLGLNRIQAGYFKSNPASGRIMQKIGMSYEGCLREHVNKWGQLKDVVIYGVLRSEYPAAGTG
jgi:ribosomal-protein-alanine N-acetyltransferase